MDDFGDAAGIEDEPKGDSEGEEVAPEVALPVGVARFRGRAFRCGRR